MSRHVQPGHANFFPSVPVVTTKEWDLLQTYDHRTLMCTVALRGTGGDSGVWLTAVADIISEVDDRAGTHWQPGAHQARGRADLTCNSTAHA